MFVSYPMSDCEKTDTAGCRLYGSKAWHLYLRSFLCLPCLPWQVHGIRGLGIAVRKEVRSVGSANGAVACMSESTTLVITPRPRATYLVKEPLGVMGPANGRKLYKPDLVTEAAFVVVHTLAINGNKRFASLTDINRAKVATLQSVMTVSQL